MRQSIASLALLAGRLWEAPAEAQRRLENAAREADDGFGKESIGISLPAQVTASFFW